MKDRLAALLLAAALTVVLGWPALATIWAASQGSGGGSGGGLIAPSATDLEAGRVVRPLRVAATTVKLVVLTEALALPVGLALALVLFRTDVWGRRALIGLIALAVFVPLPLHAAAWLGAFGNVGRAQAIGSAPLLVGLRGAAFVHAAAALPWVVLLAGIGLRTVEPELEESALLDWPVWRVALSITLRRSLGALAGAALAVAVLTAGDMTVTDLLQVRTYAEEAYVQFQLGGGPGAAAAVALPPLLVLGGLILFAIRGLARTDPARLASAAWRGRPWRLGRRRVPLGLLVVTLAGNLIALPLYGLVWRAGRVGGSARLGRPPHWSLAGFLGTMRFAFIETIHPLIVSAFWAAVGASATIVLAWSLAWVSRKKGVWGWVVAVSVALALAVPGPVAGMALVLAYRTPGWVVSGSEALFTLGASLHGLDVPGPVLSLIEAARQLLNATRILEDSPVQVVMAAVLRTFPYALLVLWPAVRAVPPEYLDAAALDGHDTWGQVRRVALPLTRGAVVAAWGVSFALALGELPATNLVAPPGLTTVSLIIWSLLHTGVESHLAGVALVVLSALASAGGLAAWALSRWGRGQAPIS